MPEIDTQTLLTIFTQGRIEDREDLKQLRNEMTTLAKSVNTLTVTLTEFVSDTRHINKEIEDIKEDIHGEGGIVSRVGSLEVSQAEDGRNWLLLGTLAVIVLTGLVGYYFTIVEPVQSANVKSEEIRQLIQSIEGKLQ